MKKKKYKQRFKVAKLGNFLTKSKYSEIKNTCTHSAFKHLQIILTKLVSPAKWGKIIASNFIGFL